MTKNVVKFLLAELIYNGHLQALGAVGIVYTASIFAYRITTEPLLLFITYCLFQLIYYFDRMRDIEIDSSTNTERSAHLKKYQKKVPLIVGLLFLVVIVGNLVFGTFYSLLTMVAIAIMGILYPIYFKGLTRKIFMFKNVYVAIVHALLVYIPFVYYSANPLNFVLAILFVYIFFEVMVCQVALDMKDIKSDKAARLLTFPAVFDVSKSLLVMQILSFTSLAFGIFTARYLYSYASQYFILVLVTFLINQYVIFRLKKSIKSGLIIAASKFFLWLCLAIIVNMVV